MASLSHLPRIRRTNKLNISIVGAGVAGSYAAKLLNEHRYNIRVYDGNLRRGHMCAWGAFHSLLKSQLSRVGLNVDDYILCKTKNLVLNGVPIPLRNEISIDKPKMLEDMWPKRWVNPRHVPLIRHSANLTVNATAKPLGPHLSIPTIQYKTKLKGIEKQTAYVEIDPNYTGYCWIFPLDEEGREFHLGAGCVNRDPELLISKMKKKHRLNIASNECKCTRSIAVINPDEAIIYRDGIVSIGEAVGAVYPVTGEGTIPALESAYLLTTALKNNTFPQGYINDLKTLILNDNKPSYKIWRFMEKHPKTAWLLGFGHMFGRAKTRTQPVLNAKIVLKLIKEYLTCVLEI